MKEIDVRILNYIIIAVMATGLISAPVFGQEQSTGKKKESTASEVKTADKEAAKTTGRYLPQKKEQYQKKVEAKLLHIEDNMKRLYITAEKKGAKAKEKITRAADDLKKKSDSAKNKLKDLKESGEEKWDHARVELDSMLKDLERSYSRIAAKFKE